MSTELHIGIDDTDSEVGGCTTYTAALLFERLVHSGFEPLDIPWLVRLNPNIPWKTRGNGAVALHFRADERELARIRRISLATVGETCEFSRPGTDPALVFLRGEIPDVIRPFSERALHDVIRVHDARNLAKTIGAEVHLLRGTRGVIGALAALGYDLHRQHTFEIIAYREKDNLGSQRKVDHESVFEMAAKFRGSTFNNVDDESGRVLVYPHGPDPVLLGIRGEDPESLLDAYSGIKIREPVERVCLFRTNQGTDAHLSFEKRVQELRPYHSAVITGVVESNPVTIRGGHVIFRVGEETGCVDCAAYEPTGSFRKVVSCLRQGDEVKVAGGICSRPGVALTLNLERLEVLRLAEVFEWKNPSCSVCHASCESMGKGQGFRCRKCGLRFPRESIMFAMRPRRIHSGVYVPPPRANRHLTKPLSRYLLDHVNEA